MTIKGAPRFVATGAVAMMIGGCAGTGSSATAPETVSPVALATASVPASPSAEPTPSEVPNPCDDDIGELPVGATCWIEPNLLATLSTDTAPVRVLFTIPAPGWSAFIGAFKDGSQGDALQRVNVLFADIKNLTVNACTRQLPAAPQLGPAVDDLANALAALPPFEVTSPPSDVTAFGYAGKHIELTVPLDLPFDVDSRTFTGCGGGVLRAWIAPPLSYAFNGYTAPGDTEEFWILDVEGTRLVIVALASANASPEMIAEQQAVLDSIVIKPGG
jgi:hypothetical protein